MQIDEIFKDASPRSYARGQVILYQGENVENIFYIRSGYVKVYDITSEGREKLMMILGPEDIFPLVWSVSGKHSLNYFYEVFEDADVCALDRDKFLELNDEHHDVTKAMLRYFLTRTSELMLRIECIEATSAKHKVVQVLEYLALSHGKLVTEDTYTIKLSITQQNIADMAGITRETTSLQLQELQKEKIVTSRNSHMVIHTDRIAEFNSQ